VNRRYSLFGGAALAAILLVFSSCTQGAVGIFATIEQEEKIKTNNLVDNASIRGLVLGEFGANERYVALANTKLFFRNRTGSQWRSIAAPSGRLATYVAGIDTDADGVDERVYAVYANVNSDRYAIYELLDDMSWSAPVYEPANNVTIRGMRGFDTNATSGILVSQYAPNSSLRNERVFLSWIDEVTATPGATHVRDQSRDTSYPDDVVSLGDDIRDVAITNDTTPLAIIIGESGGAYSLPAGDLGVADTDYSYLVFDPQGAGIDDDELFPAIRGVGVRQDTGTADDTIVLVDSDGRFYISESNGAAWDRINVSSSRSFTDILWVPQIGSSGAFVVGTETRDLENTVRRGYYHAFVGGSPGSYTVDLENDLGNSYNGSDLAVGSIDSFRLLDTNRLFALTTGLGLWSTAYTVGSTRPDWTWE
jgi:hypothetical protein